jgi:hypothetical protein
VLALILLDVVGVACCCVVFARVQMFCFDDACFALLREEFHVVGFAKYIYFLFLHFIGQQNLFTLISPLCPYISIFTWVLIWA